MPVIYFLLLAYSIQLSFSSQSHPGHLKPFGSAGILLPIAELSGNYPNVSSFFNDHLSKSNPVLSRQVLINDLHYDVWQLDQQLLGKVDGLASTEVLVQSYREIDRIPMSFADFLARYKRENLFFGDSLPGVLR